MTNKKWIERYTKSTKRWLTECYNRPSKTKEIADMFVRESCENNGGYDFRIISYNTFTFTVGYRMIKGGHEYLVIHTYRNTKVIKL